MTLALASLAVALFLALLTYVASDEDFRLPRQAKRRARQLFLSKLDGKQRRSWESRRNFDIVASSGCCYTISPYGAFNIRNCSDEFCVLIDAKIPVYDKLLAQRLLVEADENLFLTVANRRRR
jgi:hypothetical protein